MAISSPVQEDCTRHARPSQGATERGERGERGGCYSKRGMNLPEPLPVRPAAADEPARVVVVVPCHNEAATVAKVVRDFQAALPRAEVVVVDNASTDGTAELARAAGARVIVEPPWSTA